MLCAARSCLPIASILAVACALLFAGPFAGREAARADGEDGGEIAAVVELLAEVDDDALRIELLAGLEEGLRGRDGIAMPESWPRAFAALRESESRDVRERALALALLFDDPKALETLRETLVDREATRDSRLRALRALGEKKPSGFGSTLRGLLSDSDLRAPVIRALASFDDAETGAAILRVWDSLDPAERSDAVSTLASRTSWALELLEAARAEKISPRAISAIHARQLRNLGDERVTALLREVWGDVRAASADKRELIREMKASLRPEVLEKGDPRRGRVLFEKTCAKCHRLYESGGDIGPELTGSNRADLDYILENVLDPSAMIGKDYQLYTAVTKDGRVLSGLLKERGAGRITIRTETDAVVLSESDVLQLEEAPVSMMPEGLLVGLSKEEIRDLIVYLGTKAQVPLPEGGGESACEESAP